MLFPPAWNILKSPPDAVPNTHWALSSNLNLLVGWSQCILYVAPGKFTSPLNVVIPDVKICLAVISGVPLNPVALPVTSPSKLLAVTTPTTLIPPDKTLTPVLAVTIPTESIFVTSS